MVVLTRNFNLFLFLFKSVKNRSKYYFSCRNNYVGETMPTVLHQTAHAE